ncbi:hypothetical protein M141_0591 [Bacteroides fragilis str. S38L5]|nr:hypothetical protein M141_0591 [Bacteroides fragilis str. S38L5]EYB16118.1 hypothetical protein M140_0542 [Bacteroides fragilis str. S38L3]
MILSSVQIVVLAQMYVLLKQFTQLNNTIPNKKDKGCLPNGKQPLFISFQTFGKL